LESVRPLSLLNFHATSFQQFQLAIERAKSDPEFSEDSVSTPRVLSEKDDEAM